MNLNIELVSGLMKNKQYQDALTHFTNVISNENDDNIKMILDGIKHLLPHEIDFSKRQIQKLKDLFDYYDEYIQEMAIELYLKILKKDTNLMDQELEFCFSMMKNYEPLIRDRFIDFMIEYYNYEKRFQNRILNEIVACLNDKNWKIRLKIIDFIGKIFKEQSDLIYEKRENILKLLNEKDLDVLAEAMDFVYILIIETYSSSDLQDFIETFNKRDWYFQERMLWLLGKIGVNFPHILENYFDILIQLLDHENLLVQKRVGDMFAEIVCEHNSILDDIIFKNLSEEKLENIEELEELLFVSLYNSESQRFIELFEKYSPSGNGITQIFANIMKRIEKEIPQLNKKILTEQTTKLIYSPKPNLLRHFEDFLAHLKQYDLYLLVYQTIEQHQDGPNSEALIYDQQLKEFLVSEMPYIQYHKLARWINDNIQKNKILIEELCKIFNINEDECLKILQTLLEKGLIDVVIQENFIQNPNMDNTSNQNGNKDILISKRWEIRENVDKIDKDIKFMVKITNISSQKINNISLFFHNPEDILLYNTSNNQTKNIIESLSPQQSHILNWNFKKNQDSKKYSGIMKLYVMYESQNRTNTLEKKLEILSI